MLAGMTTSPLGTFILVTFTLYIEVLASQDIGGEGGFSPCGLSRVEFNFNPKFPGSSCLLDSLKIFLLLTPFLLSLARGERLPSLLR